MFSKEKLIAYIQLMRLDRPIGTLLLLWPTLWALFLSVKGIPPFSILTIFILGVIFMRAAGCVINDYADRNIDGQVKRTLNRPLATGRATPKEAKDLVYGIACLFVGFGVIPKCLCHCLVFHRRLINADLPFHETLHPLAAAVFGHGIRLVDSHGVWRDYRAVTLRMLDFVYCQFGVDGGLRYAICHGGSR